jgi:hypothetical protein
MEGHQMKPWIAACLFLSLGFFAAPTTAQEPKAGDLPAPTTAQEPKAGDLPAPTTAQEPKAGDLPATSIFQGPKIGDLPAPAAEANPEQGHVGVFNPAHCCPYPPGRVWVGADFLLWWTKGVPLPPLLTTSPPGTPEPVAGVLGQPGTSILFGDHEVNSHVRPGIRATLGGWFNQDHTTGIEANFFYLGTETSHFNASSDGIPILARPFVFENPADPRFGQNGSEKIAFPGLVKGDFHANVSSSLTGTDVYLRQALCCGCCCRLDFLAGYRYLRLREGLEISETETSTNPASPAFGIPFVINEGFNTRNEFNGGELGLIGEFQRNCWIVRGYAKVALGSTERTVDIHGTTQLNDLSPQTGGLLAQPSNIGNYHSSVFSVVPEVGFNLGYAITPRLRAFTGYTFMYWTRVARPGEQIDLHVNTSQFPQFGLAPPSNLGNGALVGQPLPAFSFHSSDFWAQGINFGLEFRF